MLLFFLTLQFFSYLITYLSYQNSPLMCLHPKSSHQLNSSSCSEFDFSTGLIEDNMISCDYVDSTPEKNKSSLRILQLNIRGILSKQHELRDLLITNSIDVALICETWLTSSSEDRLLISGYNYLGRVRTGRKGGRVCILVKDYLLYRPIRGLMDVEIDLEYCVAKIKTDSGPLVVCSAYRPPNGNTKDFLEEYKKLSTAMNNLKSKGLIIGLDHNLDLLKHCTHGNTKLFLDTNFELGILPSITKPTRIKNSTATLIDNIFVDCSMKLHKSLIIYDDISDHLPCLIECEGLMNSPPRRNYDLEKNF